MTLRYVGRNAIRSIATFHFQLLIVRFRLDFRRSLVSGLPSPSEFGEERGLLSRTAAGNRAYVRLRLLIVVLLHFYAGCWMRVMLNTYLAEVKIDWETGPPLDRTRKVIHPSFSWRSNRELNDPCFQNYLRGFEARNSFFHKSSTIFVII